MSGTADWKTDYIPVPEGLLLSRIFGQTVTGTALTGDRHCGWCGEAHPVGVTCTQAVSLF
jgi:hypothetical protein